MANELKMADKLRSLGDRSFNTKNVKIIVTEESTQEKIAKASPYYPDRAKVSKKMIKNSLQEAEWQKVDSSAEARKTSLFKRLNVI